MFMSKGILGKSLRGYHKGYHLRSVSFEMDSVFHALFKKYIYIFIIYKYITIYF